MIKKLMLIGILVTMISCGCMSRGAKPVSSEDVKNQQILGRVLDVHMLGNMEETVTVCHFDPRYVVSVQTESEVRKLAIHSPAQTFMGSDPVGRTYRFCLSKSDNRFLLKKAEEIDPNKAPEATR